MENKIILPSLLLAIAVISIGFATLPVDQATAVHTTIQATQLELKAVTDDDNAVVAGQIEVACGAPFIIMGMTVQFTGLADGDVLLIDTIEIDTVDLNIDAAGAGGPATIADIILVNDPGATTAAIIDVAAQVDVGGEIIFPLAANSDIDFELGGAVGLVDGDVMNVRTVILTEAQNVCTVNIEVAD